ncbi:DUF3987 domain-containing protein [Bartonella taylorii]|uniref:DUF3987 domain-containing protein n=1 Tax=Bartonella taylorii TaxID=33046 RepID=UPI002485ADBB|nr:DUF3987 domain-containing protein [Bartonella taylorii]
MPLTLSRSIDNVAESQQSSLDLIAASALCGLAAIIGNGVQYCSKTTYQLENCPSSLGGIVGRASTRKTPEMKAALAPLYDLQKEWYQEWRHQKKRQETKDILME